MVRAMRNVVPLVPRVELRFGAGLVDKQGTRPSSISNTTIVTSGTARNRGSSALIVGLCARGSRRERQR
eukprot:3187363-Prymnesium_polylepis.1